MGISPIENIFKLPSSLPSWSSGDGFANEFIDLGGLQVCQISSLNKVWSADEGGPDDIGASFFEPSEIPQGFFMLGCYSQSNNRPLYGWLLAGKDDANGALKQPTDYTLIWSSESLKIKQDSTGYMWLPTAPDGYKAVGLLVTNSSEKPSLDKIRCVRSDFTDQCVTENWIWGRNEEIDPDGFNVFSLRPKVRGIQAMGVCVGTFIAQNGNASYLDSIACLKNVGNNLSCMPNENQIREIFQAYSPSIYFHPEEKYFPASVNWYFDNGALLYKKGDESNPVRIEPNGSNLPQTEGGSYWLDLPVDKNDKETVKKGNLEKSEVYLHIKPMLGATFTDIGIWVFYPFNGPATLRSLISIPFRKVGEHVGDWEHLTLRVSNFNGELWSVYFSQHSKGSWVNASELEFQNGNRIVAYSSLNGHAMYSKPGVGLQGKLGFGMRNDTAKSDEVLDCGEKFSIVCADYLGTDVIVEPPWLNFLGKWGPKIEYMISKILVIPSLLPINELHGQDGPTGPKLKDFWIGDER